VFDDRAIEEIDRNRNTCSLPDITSESEFSYGRAPLRSEADFFAVQLPCPLCPRKQTVAVQNVMSAVANSGANRGGLVRLLNLTGKKKG